MRANKFLLCLLAFISVNSLSFAVEDKSIITVEPGIKIDYEVILSSSMNAGLKNLGLILRSGNRLTLLLKLLVNINIQLINLHLLFLVILMMMAQLMLF